MEQREMGLLFRKGWVTRNIFRAISLFIIADVAMKYQYGIKRGMNLNSYNWKWWMEKTPEERTACTLE
ncbi:hypothetical protein BdWA1_002438 [Babesia duncani]|uniref:Uncharacterized protein n=1 Tax=Babesia duncani TaxID=323732 RepID=A0AAD9PHU4_9APIC|nr:hypothetical protein BdWA1_003774 [Babesia duncani]KAK2195842.1 hypothetical protein BdWA1_002438 [Babesia duncani]